MIVHLHSDDMGATRQVTQRMLASWQADALTGFSVLANGQACDLMTAALARASQRRARIACHLNLSEGPSVAPVSRVPLLVDADGHLRHTFGSLIKTWLVERQGLVSQVEIEWQAQVERLQAQVTPRPVAAVDGHMHVHMLPFLFPVAARTAQRCGVPAIRIAREPLFLATLTDLVSPSYLINMVKHLVLRLCSVLAVPHARKLGLTSPTCMLGILYSGHTSPAAALAGLSAARRQGAQEVELVLHVGRAAEDERGRWPGRSFMADFYCSPWRDAERDTAAELAAKLRG